MDFIEAPGNSVGSHDQCRSDRRFSRAQFHTPSRHDRLMEWREFRTARPYNTAVMSLQGKKRWDGFRRTKNRTYGKSSGFTADSCDIFGSPGSLVAKMYSGLGLAYAAGEGRGLLREHALMLVDSSVPGFRVSPWLHVDKEPGRITHDQLRAVYYQLRSPGITLRERCRADDGALGNYAE